MPQSQLTLNVTIDSSQGDGNVEGWSWSVNGAPADINPPPRMQLNDTLSVVVTDRNPNGPAPTLDGLLIVSPKVENPLSGQTGKGSPFKQVNGNTICYSLMSGIASNGGSYTFTPPNNVMQEKGAWELTFVASNAQMAVQFEIDPEFDVSN